MRIAVYDNLPPGGARRSTQQLLLRLAARHEVSVYSFNEPSDYCDLGEAAAAVKRYRFRRTAPFRFPLSRLYFLWQLKDHARLRRTMRDLAAEVDAAGHDVCYLPSCGFTEAPLLPLFLRTPSVYHAASMDRNLHAADERHYQKPRHAAIQRWLPDLGYAAYRRRLRRDQEAAIRSATSVLAISFFLREHLYREYGVNARVVTRAVDTDVFACRNGAPRERLVLSVGSLEPRKAHDFVIRSLARIPEDRRPRLGIVANDGIPAEQAYLDGLARQHGVEVEWFERIAKAEGMATLYSRSAVVVCASILEGLGRVPLEAGACETPVVAVAEGGLRETVRPGVNGYLIQRSEDECAEAVSRCLADADAARHLGRRAREEILANWTWDRVVESLEKELTAVTQRRMGA